VDQFQEELQRPENDQKALGEIRSKAEEFARQNPKQANDLLSNIPGNEAKFLRATYLSGLSSISEPLVSQSEALQLLKEVALDTSHPGLSNMAYNSLNNYLLLIHEQSVLGEDNSQYELLQWLTLQGDAPLAKKILTDYFSGAIRRPIPKITTEVQQSQAA